MWVLCINYILIITIFSFYLTASCFFHTKPRDWLGNVSEMTYFVEWDVKLNQ